MMKKPKGGLFALEGALGFGWVRDVGMARMGRFPRLFPSTVLA